MVALLFAIAIVMLVVGLIGVFWEGGWDSGWGIFSIVAIVLVCCIGIWGTVEICYLGTANTIDEKIAMYEEENAKIEEEIEALVSSYMEFEKDTYGSLKAESSVTLVSLFPELKSDQLVQQQLEIYVRNSNKIKYLKEEQIDIAKCKWRLYFGK